MECRNQDYSRQVKPEWKLCWWGKEGLRWEEEKKTNRTTSAVNWRLQRTRCVSRRGRGQIPAKTEILEENSSGWLASVPLPRPSVAARWHSRPGQLDQIFHSYFDGAATRAPLAPEEDEDGRLGNEDQGHPAESVIDGTHSVDRCLSQRWSTCVFMKRGSDGEGRGWMLRICSAPIHNMV